ncbi:hypothetical protein [Absidia glauca]|uniref:Uncharacterized protein n=1 Tax=Absidia glauca TaxID=4829 RepID=A0A168LKH6_ABSGL|nr:hypothetical protein [Absidia glauca]
MKKRVSKFRNEGHDNDGEPPIMRAFCRNPDPAQKDNGILQSPGMEHTEQKVEDDRDDFPQRSLSERVNGNEKDHAGSELELFYSE